MQWQDIYSTIAKVGDLLIIPTSEAFRDSSMKDFLKINILLILLLGVIIIFVDLSLSKMFINIIISFIYEQ